jgi:hypothetical protein
MKECRTRGLIKSRAGNLLALADSWVAEDMAGAANPPQVSRLRRGHGPRITPQASPGQRQLRMFLGRHVMHNYASKAGDGRTGPLHSTASGIADKQGHPAQINRSGPGSRSSSAAAPASASACRCGACGCADCRWHSHLATGCRAAAKFAGELLGIQLRGPLGLALPLVRRRMQRELQREIATIKATLEAPSKPFERSG